MPVYAKNGILKATPRARGGSLTAPSPAPRVADPGTSAAELRSYRIRRIEARAEQERKRFGSSDTKAVKRAQKRARGAASTLATTPEGREALARENAILDGAGAAYAMLGKTVDELRPVIALAVDAYASDVHEFGFESEAARRWALQSALFSAVAMFLLGEGAEMGVRTMSGTRSAKSAEGVHGSIHVAGFKDVVTLAALCSAKAQYAGEMSWRAEDRARLEAKERDRQRMHRVMTARIEADRARAELERAADDEDMNVGGDPRTSIPADGEHGLSVEATPKTPSTDRDDFEEHDARRVPGASSSDGEASPDEDDEPAAALNAFIADQQFCRVRNRMVWGALANTPLPSGPGYPERRAEEARAIADWDKRVSIARHAQRTKSRQR